MFRHIIDTFIKGISSFKLYKYKTHFLLSFQREKMSSLVNTLAIIQQYLTVTLGVLLVIGVIGNVLNCSVFLRKRLRTSPCSMFFAASSLANMIVMIYYIIPTIYSAYNNPTENSNLVYCKLRLYIRNALLVISRTYLTLACVACYAVSSRNARMRNLSRPKNVIRIIIIVPVIWFIIPLHIPFLTSIQNGTCKMWAGAGALYHSIYICFVAAILPTSLMIVFSLLAYRNLRQMKRNVVPLNIPRAGQEQNLQQSIENTSLQQRDRQLSMMLFVQIVVYLVLTICYPIQTVYNAVVLIIGGSKSAERTAIENFILFITSSFLLNCYSATSFFIFLTSKTFRKELKQVFNTFMCQNNQIWSRRHETQTRSLA